MHSGTYKMNNNDTSDERRREENVHPAPTTTARGETKQYIEYYLPIHHRRRRRRRRPPQLLSRHQQQIPTNQSIRTFDDARCAIWEEDAWIVGEKGVYEAAAYVLSSYIITTNPPPSIQQHTTLPTPRISHNQ